MTVAEQDELIRKALLDAIAFEWEDSLADAPEAPISERQTKRMHAMLRDPIGYAKRYARPKWKWIAEKVAIFILLFALSFGALYAASPTVRATVSKWIAELRETDIVYYFFGERDNDTLPYYEITALPAGYIFQKQIETLGHRCIIYENSDEQRIYLQYRLINSGRTFSVDIENMSACDVIVNGCTGQAFLSDDSIQGNIIIWNNDSAEMQFCIDAYMDKDDLLILAESVMLNFK